jgi:hypothetical protein
MISAGAGSLSETTWAARSCRLIDWEAPQNGFDELGRRRPLWSRPTKTIAVAHQLHLLLFTNMAHQDAARVVVVGSHFGRRRRGQFSSEMSTLMSDLAWG